MLFQAAMKTLGFMLAILVAVALLLMLWNAIFAALTRPGLGDARASDAAFCFCAGGFGAFVVLGALALVLRRIDRT
jgi:hypothetical protein